MDNTTEIPRRKCSKCGEEHPLTPERWFRDKTKKTGFRDQCKECISTSQRARRPLSPARIIDGKKQCTKCGQWFPRNNEHFYGKTGAPENLEPQCKSCRNAMVDAWRRENPEKARGYTRSHRKNNRDHYREYSRRHRAENSEKYKELSRQNYARHRDEYAASRRARYQQNPLPGREAAQRWRLNNPEKCREVQRRAYKRNPRTFLDATKRWAAKNRDKTRGYQAKWRQNNPERSVGRERNNPEGRRLAYHRYASKKRALPSTLSSDSVRKMLEYFDNSCAYCGRAFGVPGAKYVMALDHFIPLSSGDCPGTVPENIVCACHGPQGCNNRKSSKDPATWVMEHFGNENGTVILEHIRKYFQMVSMQ